MAFRGLGLKARYFVGYRIIGALWHLDAMDQSPQKSPVDTLYRGILEGRNTKGFASYDNVAL